MFGKVAHSAKKSISLSKDMVFRLLIAMTILLGWLSGVGTGVVMSLEKVYENWHLEQENQVSIYLLADAEEETVVRLEKDLLNLAGVERVKRQPAEDTQNLIADYFVGADILPTPIVIDVVVAPTVNRENLDAKVYSYFVEAQIDDARDLLARISKVVRLGQVVMILFASIMAVIMILLVSLTVRAGLRGKRQSLAVLQYVGATDAFIVRLVVRQVFWQSLTGWFVSAMLIASVLQSVKLHWADLAPFMTQDVYIYAICTPLLLTLMATLTAWLSSYGVIQRSRQGV